MKTTVEIPDEVMKEAMRHSGAASKREAVLKAMEEYNHRRRMARLTRHLGTFEKFMTPAELDKLREDEGDPVVQISAIERIG